MFQINALSSAARCFRADLRETGEDNDKLSVHLLVTGPRINIFLIETGLDRIDLSQLSCLA